MNIFQAILRYGHDEDYDPKLEPQPTAAKPGSIEKIQVLRSRIERGEWLFHDGDNRMAGSMDGQTMLGTYVREQAKIDLAERKANAANELKQRAEMGRLAMERHKQRRIGKCEQR